ncbi:MAG: hypothetical protein HYX84_05135 [Chloroflexi bacterium]|nr:hypothetical protein [Chloroflexota bacterium]
MIGFPRFRIRFVRRSFDWLDKLVISSALGVLLVILSPLFVPHMFFRIPQPSAEFDCDDATLLMWRRLNSIGIKSTPILGNLKTTGEAYLDTDHIWLLVNVAGGHIAMDWGRIYFDRQHYEGYLTNHDQLLAFVAQDFASQGGRPASVPSSSSPLPAD